MLVFSAQWSIMYLDMCPCNICSIDICPSDNCSSDTCPGSHISGVIDQFLTTLVVEDCPNLVRIWPINTCPGNNCPCNICSCNICPGDICPGDICPGDICPGNICLSSHISGTADQIFVKLWISSGNGLGNNWPGYIHPGNFWLCQKYPFNNHPCNNWN